MRNLIDCASKGGNYLLNVGPTSEGLIPDASVERLAEIGEWMKVNGESIYGTTASPFPRVPGAGPLRSRALYLHVFQWPADGRLSVPLRNAATTARLFASPDVRIPIARQPESLELTLPTSAPDPIATVIALDLVGAPDVVAVYSDPGGRRQLRAHGGGGDAGRTRGTGRAQERRRQHRPLGRSTGHGRLDPSRRPARHVCCGGGLLALAPGSDGSRVRFECGANRLDAQLKSTGGWDNFQTVALGDLRVTGTGPQPFKLAPVAKPGEGVVNLRALPPDAQAVGRPLLSPALSSRGREARET